MLDRAALYAEIDRHFLSPESLSRIALFGRAGRQAEGWFRGEMLFLLDRLAREKQIEGWRADVPVTQDGRQRCDFRIGLAGGPLWLETKALAGGHQADLGVFFPRSGGFTDDIVKLLRVHEGDRAVLLFVLPRPNESSWAELLAGYARRVAPISFREESAVEAYPEAVYVCKLSLEGGF